MLRRTLLAGVGMLALAAMPASAADLGRAPVYKAPVVAPVPVFNWTGFYIGVHGGYSTSSRDATEICTEDLIFGGGCVLIPPAVVGSADADGFLFGGQLGFNYQVGQWVWGIEGQWSWTDSDGCGALSFGGVLIGLNACANVNWYATIAGRVGYAFDRALFYVKGGFAFADEEYSLRDLAGFNLATVGDTRTGWMLGVGLEYAFTNNWSAKIEYNYMDFGGDSYSFVDNFNGFRNEVDIDQIVHVVKFGINYRFGGPVVAAY